MTMLNLEAALELYDLLGPCLPDVGAGHEAFGDYAQEILRRLREENPAAYPHALCLMSGKTMEELHQMDVAEIVMIFLVGISENQVESLRMFAEGIGYGR